MTQDVETVDLVGSYARRSGDLVDLVIVLPGAKVARGAAVELRLRSQERRARVHATVEPRTGAPGVVVRASVPRQRLRPDVYRIAIRTSPEEPFRRVQARLLTSRKQPIALLPGPVPRTVMAPPRPAGRRAAAPAAARQTPAAGSPVRRAAHVVDLALDRLPADRARRYRSTLRSVARRARLI